MMEMLKELTPMLWEGTVDTLYMTVLSTFFAYLLGLPMGVLLSITDKGGILENRPFNTVFGWIIHILRSFPLRSTPA